MKSIALVSALFLVACAHVEPPKVSMELPFAPGLVQEMQNSVGRVPASFEAQDVEGKSPRRVYFTALYHQYLTLGQHLELNSELNSCPQFHHDKVETDSSFIPKLTISASNVDNEEKYFFPELVFTKKFSLNDYFKNIGEEIEVLCEEGVSDNYYKFDNLITHYASKQSFHMKADSMKSVLKIPVFANYYLLKMLGPSHSLSFAHPQERRVIDLTRTHWFEKYVAEAHRKRTNLIRNRMVQR